LALVPELFSAPAKLLEKCVSVNTLAPIELAGAAR
jgi:hypothetical protein